MLSNDVPVDDLDCHYFSHHFVDVVHCCASDVLVASSYDHEDFKVLYDVDVGKERSFQS